MKLCTHVLPKVLHRTISIFLTQLTKEASYRDFSNAKNRTFGSGTADAAPAHLILPLPTHSVADPNTFQIFLPWLVASKKRM